MFFMFDIWAKASILRFCIFRQTDCVQPLIIIIINTPPFVNKKRRAHKFQNLPICIGYMKCMRQTPELQKFSYS